MRLRRRSDRADDDPGVAIRRAISAITAARETATRNAAAALVNQAQIGRALAVQRADLSQAMTDVDTAVAAAQRVAADARETDGAEAAAPYELHVSGLRSQRDVLGAAVEQVDQLRDVSGEHVERARQLLTSSRRELDAALREQLRLLIAVERLDRARLIAAARARRAHPDPT